MSTNLLEVDGAQVTRFGGGSANFKSYRGKAYQVDDELGRFVCLTPVQAERIALAINNDLHPAPADDGGPAFPGEGHEGGEPFFLGMTLREYIAAKILTNVMPGLLSNQVTVSEAITTAYEVADAMIAKRKAVARG